ncbi:hypothetical protein [Leclercia sp. UBA7405]|uniref:hypothetical protein n=1 Tax=Leclercia sp. UBA7405 TaxID=1946743 RepID=UPI00301A3C4B
MDYTRSRTGADVLNILKAYRDELHELDLRKPHWPVLERLINRELEMTPVWNDIAGYALTPEQCRTLLEQLFFAGAYGSEEENSRLKKDYAKLSALNAGIARKAVDLARMWAEREDILNHHAINLDHPSHIVDLIDKACSQNGHYHSYLRDPLEALRGRYGDKYWPSLQQILDVVANESPVAAFRDRSDEAIVQARGAAVPDLLRRLFSNLHDARVKKNDWRSAHIFLPTDLRLSDASLATLATVLLDLDEPVSVDSIKIRRNALYKDGFPGAWAPPREISPGGAI